MTLITTNTSSNAASSDFTSSIDNSYKLYVFHYYDVNPATDNVDFGFQGNVDGQSGYNETINSQSFRTYHDEADSSEAVGYDGNADQPQGTALQLLNRDCGNGADESSAGELFLFNPSGTTYVTNFYARTNVYTYHNYTATYFIGGYFNVTGAIDEIQFKMSSGNMDAVIKMYGVG